MSKKLPSPCLFLTIQPDGMAKFAHERADEYNGLTVEGTLIAEERGFDHGI